MYWNAQCVVINSLRCIPCVPSALAVVPSIFFFIPSSNAIHIFNSFVVFISINLYISDRANIVSICIARRASPVKQNTHVHFISSEPYIYVCTYIYDCFAFIFRIILLHSFFILAAWTYLCCRGSALAVDTVEHGLQSSLLHRSTINIPGQCTLWDSGAGTYGALFKHCDTLKKTTYLHSADMLPKLHKQTKMKVKNEHQTHGKMFINILRNG